MAPRGKRHRAWRATAWCGAIEARHKMRNNSRKDKALKLWVTCTLLPRVKITFIGGQNEKSSAWFSFLIFEALILDERFERNKLKIAFFNFLILNKSNKNKLELFFTKKKHKRPLGCASCLKKVKDHSLFFSNSCFNS